MDPHHQPIPRQRILPIYMEVQNIRNGPSRGRSQRRDELDPRLEISKPTTPIKGMGTPRPVRLPPSVMLFLKS
jgi:hypothetical protein